MHARWRAPTAYAVVVVVYRGGTARNDGRREEVGRSSENGKGSTRKSQICANTNKVRAGGASC